MAAVVEVSEGVMIVVESGVGTVVSWPAVEGERGK